MLHAFWIKFKTEVREDTENNLWNNFKEGKWIKLVEEQERTSKV